MTDLHQKFEKMSYVGRRTSEEHTESLKQDDTDKSFHS